MDTACRHPDNADDDRVFILPDDPHDEFDPWAGVVQRLAWLTAGVALVSVLGLVAPPWLSLLVLAVWFLPLAVHIAKRKLMVICGSVLLVIALLAPWAAWRAWDWHVFSFFAAPLLEECVVVVTIAIVGGSLF